MTSKRKGITSLWWLPMIAGLVAIGLGVWSFINPAETLQLFGGRPQLGLGVGDVAY